MHYTDLGGVAYCTLRLCAVAPKLHALTACFCTDHESKSRARENDAIKRCGKHKVYEAAAGITQYTVLQQTVSVFFSFGKWKEYILKEG